METENYVFIQSDSVHPPVHPTDKHAEACCVLGTSLRMVISSMSKRRSDRVVENLNFRVKKELSLDLGSVPSELFRFAKLTFSELSFHHLCVCCGDEAKEQR